MLWFLCSVALATPTEDLLDQMADGAQVVGLGESWHGMESFAEVRAEATRYLIEHHGFRVLAVETPYLLARAADEWLREVDDMADLDVVMALHGFFYAWQDVSTAELLLWARDFNAEHPEDPIRVVGFDIQERRVVSHLRSLFDDNPDALSETSCQLRLSQPPEVYRDCFRWFDEVESRLSDLDAASQDEAMVALDAGRVFARYLVLRSEDDWRAARALRDEAMADRLMESIDLGPGGDRVVIWAHNGHLQESAEGVHDRRGPLGLIRHPRDLRAGGHWKAALGDGYRAIALSSTRVGGRHSDRLSGPHGVPRRLGSSEAIRVWDLRVEDPFEGRIVETSSGWMHPRRVYSGWIHLPVARVSFVATRVVRAETEAVVHEVDTWSHETEAEVMAPIRRAFELRGYVESMPGLWVREEGVIRVDVQRLDSVWRVTLGPG